MDPTIVLTLAGTFLSGTAFCEIIRRLVPSSDRKQDTQDKFQADLMSELDDLRQQVVNLRIQHAAEMAAMQTQVNSLTTEVSTWRQKYFDVKLEYEVMKVRVEANELKLPKETPT